MKKAQLLTAAALAVSAASLNTAFAADLGGGCCADLEERVAELEATTARKGNRVVSLTIGGAVNKTLLTWDDGFDSDTYVVDSSHYSSRFNFKGEAKIDPSWKAGFFMEIEVRDNASNTVFQGDDEGIGDNIRLRHSNVYVESDKLGRFTIGQQSSAAKDIQSISLVTNLDNGNNDYAAAFRIRESDGDNTGLNWGQLAAGLDGNRGDFIRYDTPSVAGFILSAAWGEDDYWDVALRYKGQWNSIQIAGGIGYTSADNSATAGEIPEFEQIAGSVSVLHAPTGLFVNVSGGTLDSDALADEASFIYGEVGISRKFTSYGATTLYVGYGHYQDFAAGVTGSNTITGATLDAFTVESSEVNRYGIGVVQSFDAAALDLYAQAHFYDADVTELGGNEVETEDLFLLMTGMRIRF